MYSHYSKGLKNSRPEDGFARNWLGRWLSLLDTYPLYVLGLIFVLAVMAALILNRDRLPPAQEAGENDT